MSASRIGPIACLLLASCSGAPAAPREIADVPPAPAAPPPVPECAGAHLGDADYPVTYRLLSEDDAAACQTLVQAYFEGQGVELSSVHIHRDGLNARLVVTRLPGQTTTADQASSEDIEQFLSTYAWYFGTVDDRPELPDSVSVHRAQQSGKHRIETRRLPAGDDEGPGLAIEGHELPSLPRADVLSADELATRFAGRTVRYRWHEVPHTCDPVVGQPDSCPPPASGDGELTIEPRHIQVAQRAELYVRPDGDVLTVGWWITLSLRAKIEPSEPIRGELGIDVSWSDPPFAPNGRIAVDAVTGEPFE